MDRQDLYEGRVRVNKVAVEKQAQGVLRKESWHDIFVKAELLRRS